MDISQKSPSHRVALANPIAAQKTPCPEHTNIRLRGYAATQRDTSVYSFPSFMNRDYFPITYYTRFFYFSILYITRGTGAQSVKPLAAGWTTEGPGF